MGTATMTLRVLGVSFSYEAREVLKGVTLTLRGGEFVGLMGPTAPARPRS